MLTSNESRPCKAIHSARHHMTSTYPRGATQCAIPRRAPSSLRSCVTTVQLLKLGSLRRYGLCLGGRLGGLLLRFRPRSTAACVAYHPVRQDKESGALPSRQPDACMCMLKSKPDGTDWSPCPDVTPTSASSTLAIALEFTLAFALTLDAGSLALALALALDGRHVVTASSKQRSEP